MIRPATVLIQLAGYCSMSNRRDTLYAQQSRSVSVPLAVRVGGVVSLSLSFTWLAPLSSPLFSLHLLFTTARNYNAKQSVTVTLHLSSLLDKHWTELILCTDVAGNGAMHSVSLLPCERTACLYTYNVAATVLLIHICIPSKTLFSHE